MKHRLFYALSSLFLISPLAGCYSIQHYVENPRGEVSFDDQSGRTNYHFKEEGRYFYVLGGLIPVYSPKMDDLLGKHIKKGNKLKNLRITQEFGPIDLGIGYLSSVLLPIGIGARTVTYEGDVERSNYQREEE